MNIHLNHANERELKLAETLTSFSDGPVSQVAEPPNRRTRRLVLPLCLSAMICGSAVGIVLYQPDVFSRLETTVAALRAPADMAGNGASETTPVEGAGTGKAEQAAMPVAAAHREITGSGLVVAPHMTTVFSKYEGQITHVAVSVGDTVEPGQVLVTLDDATARFELEKARAASAAAQLVLAARAIDLVQSRTLLDRTEILAAGNAASRQTLDEARASLELASNAVAQARQALSSDDLSIRIAEERLAALTVRAPFSGTVTRLDAHVGDTVLARADSVRENQSLLTITDTTSMVIDADIAEANMAALRPGLLGEAVLDGFPDRPFSVEVLRLAPIASAEKGTISLRLSLIHPPEGIRPNMAARIRISLNAAGDMPQ